VPTGSGTLTPEEAHLEREDDPHAPQDERRSRVEDPEKLSDGSSTPGIQRKT